MHRQQNGVTPVTFSRTVTNRHGLRHAIFDCQYRRPEMALHGIAVALPYVLALFDRAYQHMRRTQQIEYDARRAK